MMGGVGYLGMPSFLDVMIPCAMMMDMGLLKRDDIPIPLLLG